MCGIAGFVSGGRNRGELTSICKLMVEQIRHRGPDASGVWCAPSHRVALGHARLSILDLSTNGNQPMHSVSERYVMVFNGEVYNFAALRAELEQEGFSFRGHSDTEVMLAAFECWGVKQALMRFVGMFALALWDNVQHTLFLARDRMGEKPLYYGWSGGQFLFASELKAISAHPGFIGKINRDALTLFLRHNYVPAPYSIWRGINKLTPGTFLSLSQGADEPEIEEYWSIDDAITSGGAQSLFRGSADEAVDELDSRLAASVADQMVADVPLGAFLSGGIDSSAVVALMQAHSSRPVKTFSIGFHEEFYNEAKHAKAVARHLGTEHHELYVTPNQAMDVISQLPRLYDEPFADSSQIPTFLLAQMTRQHVTVSLSGDGGDELFCGYNRYDWARALWDKFDRVPVSVRTGIARLMTSLPPRNWDRLFSIILPLLPGKYRYGSPGDKLHKVAELFSVQTPEQIYHQLVSHWKKPSDVVIGGSEPLTVLTERRHHPEFSSFEDRMMYLDQLSYLPDDILVKVDRAAMGVSLETRIPMLDHRVVEFAWSLPLNYKLRKGQTKWPLRQVLYRYVPKELIERPKMGFGVPIDKWLRGPLRDWAEALLDNKRLQEEGYFNPTPIHDKWREHLSGRRNWAYYLWDILIFQAWLESVK